MTDRRRYFRAYIATYRAAMIRAGYPADITWAHARAIWRQAYRENRS